MDAPKNVSKKQKAEADEIAGIVVEHLEDGVITVVDRHELLAPARGQRVLYVSPEPPPVEPPPVEPDHPAA